MKSIRVPVFALLLVATLPLGTGCDKHYVDVYINRHCALVSIDNDTAIDPLTVFPGDHVIFNNLSGGEVTIDFPDGMFDQDPVTIPDGKRAIVKVVATSHASGDMAMTCDGGSGNPKVVVGDDP